VRRLAITFLVGTATVLLGSLLAPAAAGATPPSEPAEESSAEASGLAAVDVLQVSGLFDEVVVDSIEQALSRSVERGSQALILQLNSRGAVVSEDRMTDLLQEISDAPIAVGVWVGPNRGARAYGLPAQLMAVADVTAMVAGSRIGYISEPLPVDGQPISFGPATDELIDGSMTFSEARASGVLRLDTPDEGVPTVRSMVLAMDEVEAGGVRLDTVVDVVQADGSTQKQSTLVRFDGLGLISELMHTVASPPVAFLLFAIGLALLIFEFFTAGVGIAGGVGALCLVLGSYGLVALTTRPWAVVVLIGAMLAFAVDVQVGIPRFWTAVGLALFVVAALSLYEPIPGNAMRIGWLPLIASVGAAALTFIVGMPSMVRTRFATPTIGREWMIGAGGSATTSISPDGVALVEGARWRARTNRATPLAAGARLRVVAIDGVTLEVEPEEGAARDYRERRERRERHAPTEIEQRSDGVVS
jgi:membrane-bound serine protease (ClpP class)